MLRLALALALVALLTGCTNLRVMSHVPISTMSRLSTMTIKDIDPQQMRVAARLPAVLEPRPQGVKVRLEIVRAGGTAQSEELALEAATQSGELLPVAKWERPGARLWVYRLSAADIARVKRLMGEVSVVSGASAVSISAGVDACYRALLGLAALPTTTLLRTNATGYFVLTEDLDLRGVVSARDFASKVPPCDA